MTDDELARRYEELRRAAAAVVTRAAQDGEAGTPTYRRNLQILEQVLDGRETGDGSARAIVDADLHLLSMRDYDSGVPEGAPFPFSGRAAEIRASLAQDDAADHPRGYYPDDWNPTLTEVQAMTVGTLLHELAARLAATGDAGGHELADVTLRLADEVLAPTFVGAQR